MTLHQVTEQQVADAAQEAWDMWENWTYVAQDMIALLGSTDAHRRIDGLREALKETAISHADLSREVMRLTRLVDEMKETAIEKATIP